MKGIDLLYHETTFLDSDADLATKTKHSTATQAASIAEKAVVNKLLLGHYSSRYASLDLFQEEAQKIFNNVELAEAGKQIAISN